jgi:ABC-type nitrate/sulfonate/bicarbonate transport system permease component
MSEKVLSGTDPFAVPTSPARAAPARAGSQHLGRASGALMLVALLVVWEVVSRVGLVSPALLPPASRVFVAWAASLQEGELLAALGETLGNMATGFVVAAVVGITLGVLMGRVRAVHWLLEPLIELIRPVPIPAFIPLLILFLGIDSALKVAVVFLGALFPILLAAYAGVSAVPPTMRETAQTFGLSWWETVREITIPAAAPTIFIGLRTSLAISLIVATVAEMVSGTGGIGYYILEAEQGMRIADLYAGILTLAVVGYAMNTAFLVIDRLLLHWHVGNRLRGS